MLKIIESALAAHRERQGRKTRRTQLLIEGNAILDAKRFLARRGQSSPASWNEQMDAILAELGTLR